MKLPWREKPPSLLFMCKDCGRTYETRNEIEIHKRSVHGKSFEHELTRLVREDSKEKTRSRRRDDKRERLRDDVVRFGLAAWRHMRTPAPATLEGFSSEEHRKGSRSVRAWSRACAALEKFETGKKKS